VAFIPGSGDSPIVSANAPATGIESPLRWTEQSETPQILVSPEFFFEFEMKRLAAELKPAMKAVSSEKGHDQETTDADINDFPSRAGCQKHSTVGCREGNCGACGDA
jgi:hypothetical protein